MSTESRNPRSVGLDHMTARQIVRLMNEEEQVAFRAVSAAEELLAAAGERIAESFQKGGRVIYLGAGTSARIAAMDAAEMIPSFGLRPGRFVVVQPAAPNLDDEHYEDPEDDEYASIDALNQMGANRGDAIVALAASGRTPFVLAGARHARQKGIWVCGIANNRHSPLLHESDLPIFLDTGPEVLTGSTRLKAATAQKLALNQISTVAMVLSGKVIENLMVDVNAHSHKLKERCVRIVRDLTTATEHEAHELLEQNEWSIRRVLSLLRVVV